MFEGLNCVLKIKGIELIISKTFAKKLSHLSSSSFDKESDSFGLLNRKIIQAAIDGRFNSSLSVGEIIRNIDENKKSIDKNFNSNVSDVENKKNIDKAKKIMDDLLIILIDNKYEAEILDNCLLFCWS